MIKASVYQPIFFLGRNANSFDSVSRRTAVWTVFDKFIKPVLQPFVEPEERQELDSLDEYISFFFFSNDLSDVPLPWRETRTNEGGSGIFFFIANVAIEWGMFEDNLLKQLKVPF